MSPTPGKVLVVVGGCGGIGRSLVKAAIEIKLKVVVFDLPEVIAKFPVEEADLIVGVNATKGLEIQKAFERVKEQFGGIDYLVNLVGFISSFDTIEKLDIEDWTYMLNGNLNSCMLACKEAIPHMNQGGAIVNMSSGLAVLGQKGYGPYTTSKAGVIALSKTLAAELAPLIRVNAVAPGAVQTAFLSGGLANGGKANELPERFDLAAYLKQVPLGRIAQPEDIVGPILFLLSDAASYITGQTLHINGGALMV